MASQATAEGKEGSVGYGRTDLGPPQVPAVCFGSVVSLHLALWTAVLGVLWCSRGTCYADVAPLNGQRALPLLPALCPQELLPEVLGSRSAQLGSTAADDLTHRAHWPSGAVSTRRVYGLSSKHQTHAQGACGTAPAAFYFPLLTADGARVWLLSNSGSQPLWMLGCSITHLPPSVSFLFVFIIPVLSTASPILHPFASMCCLTPGCSQQERFLCSGLDPSMQRRGGDTDPCWVLGAYPSYAALMKIAAPHQQWQKGLSGSTG